MGVHIFKDTSLVYLLFILLGWYFDCYTSDLVKPPLLDEIPSIILPKSYYISLNNEDFYIYIQSVRSFVNDSASLHLSNL